MRPHHDAQLFDQSRTLRIKQLLGLNGSTGSIRSRRSRGLIVTAPPFSWLFAGRRPRLTRVENHPHHAGLLDGGVSSSTR
jgi:hypothetical protein